MLIHKRYKGIVIKVTHDTIVLLCKGGVFKNIPRPLTEVPKLGQPYMYVDRTLPASAKMKYLSMAVIFLLAITSMIIFVPWKSESSYVLAIDINPSIEIYADQSLNVTNIKALNNDGEKIVKVIHKKNKDIYAVLEEVVEQSISLHYLRKEEQGNITITIVPLNKNGENIERNIKDIVNDALQNNVISADISVETGDLSELEEARKLNLSVNKYGLYKELKEQGAKPELEFVREKSIRQVKEKYQAEITKSSNSIDKNNKQNENVKRNNPQQTIVPKPIKPSTKKDRQEIKPNINPPDKQNDKRTNMIDKKDKVDHYPVEDQEKTKKSQQTKEQEVQIKQEKKDYGSENNNSNSQKP